jgi:hypothetical protein
MSEDLTKKLSPNADDKLTLILMAVQDLTFRVGMSEHKLEKFADKIEQRLSDTGAVLQKIISNISHLHEGQRRLEERQESLEEGQKSLEEGQKSLRSDLTSFRQHVDEKFLTLSGAVEGRYREHDQRITRLETNANQANSQT